MLLCLYAPIDAHQNSSSPICFELHFGTMWVESKIQSKNSKEFSRRQPAGQKTTLNIELTETKINKDSRLLSK